MTFKPDPYAVPIDISKFVVDLNIKLEDWQSDIIKRAFGNPEPKSVTDCPHAPGTPEHTQWINDYVIDRQVRPGTQAYRDAKERADARLARLRDACGAEKPKTFAYGKSVDELLEFIEDDTAMPSIQDYVMPAIDVRWAIQPIRPADAYSFLRSVV